MKKNALLTAIILLSIISFTSCVQLPDLTPNGSTPDSDMVIHVLEENYEDISFPYVVDELLTLEESVTLHSDYFTPVRRLSISNGDVLGELTNDNNGAYPTNTYQFEGLANSDLIGGGFISGIWKNNTIIYTDVDLLGLHILFEVYHLAYNKDVYMGIRFKNSSGQFHYGWIKFYVESDAEGGFPDYFGVCTVKEIAYNKTPGVFARIGN